MGIITGLLAMSLLGADGASSPEARPIAYQVRVLEMVGLDWRKPVLGQLQPVTRQGQATVWTAGRDVVDPLVEAAARVVAVPQVTALPESVAHFSRHTNVPYVYQLVRHADGPKDFATAVAFEPKVDGIREGFTASMIGRALDQGILTRLAFDDERCLSIHLVNVDEMVVDKDARDDKAPRGKTPVYATYHVPETARSQVAGEWLIPHDGVLVLSLGVHTGADAEGKAVVHERLAIVEARPLSDGEVFRARTSTAPTPIAPSAIAPAPARTAFAPPLPMPIPATPSRNLPQGLAADGSNVPLPPLPDDHVTPSSLPGTSEPCASPQVPHQPEAKCDPGSRQAGFEPGPESAEAARPDPARLMRFRVPLGPGVSVEIRATVRPKPAP